jgi:gamma-glutamyltranspeptidase/glutathione hydrolase
VDAAIATAVALNVVEPMMSGIGGDGFIMVYRKDTERIDISNGTGAAPYAATRDLYLGDGIPIKGIMSVSVPCLVHCWLDAHEKYGVLPLSQVFAPALDLAANGFPVTHYLAGAIASDRMLCEFPTSRAVFTRDGVPLRPGQFLYQQDLARTLEAIARDGRGAFYEGPVAEAIAKFSREQEGLLTMRDMADCRSRWQEPISTTYREHTVYEAPPNSSGHVLLQELNLVEQFDLQSSGCGTAETVHLMVEAKKLAFIDREAYVADPDYIDVPVEGLISREYARDRAELIDPKRSAMNVEPGNPWAYQARQRQGMGAGRRGIAQEHEDTTCFVVVDREGNAVCQLQSLQGAWGSSIIAGDTGILLNNRMTYWHLDPEHVDCLQPGKRVRHTMNPVMVFRDAPASENGRPGSGPTGNGPASVGRQLVYALGTPGADCQVQSNMQVITNLIDHGMTLQEAVEAPRWKDVQDGTESTLPHTTENRLLMEGRFDVNAVRRLRSMGHPVHVLGEWDGVTGREMALHIDPNTGAIHGAADPRYDGYAIGY